MSLGRRLSLLVLSELLTAVLCGTTAIVAIERLSDEARYMHNYVFAPLVELSGALSSGAEAAEALNTNAPDAPEHMDQAVARVRRFAERYHREWLVVGTNDPDARRFQAALRSVGRTELLASEREATDALDSVLRRITQPRPEQIEELRTALVRLNDVNVRYMQVAYESYEAKRASILGLFLIVGAMGAVMAPFFGMAVRAAIVPRVRRLVEKIQRFRELGLNEPIRDHAGDELALLANTLDMGFAAIVARDKERKRFLAIAAHELKTPITAIRGFAQVALSHRDDPALRDRALEVIARQSARLGRLSHDLLWVASAEGGDLPFKPGPIDLAALAGRAIGEASLVAPTRTFRLKTHGDARILGDPTLLEHAVFSLLVQAASMAPAGAVLPVTLAAGDHDVHLVVAAPAGELPAGGLDRLTEPFAVLQFEGEAEVRSTGLGLHLVREIAKLHGATLRIEHTEGAGVIFTFALRR